MPNKKDAPSRSEMPARFALAIGGFGDRNMCSQTGEEIDSCQRYGSKICSRPVSATAKINRDRPKYLACTSWEDRKSLRRS